MISLSLRQTTLISHRFWEHDETELGRLLKIFCTRGEGASAPCRHRLICFDGTAVLRYRPRVAAPSPQPSPPAGTAVGEKLLRYRRATEGDREFVDARSFRLRSAISTVNGSRDTEAQSYRTTKSTKNDCARSALFSSCPSRSLWCPTAPPRAILSGGITQCLPIVSRSPRIET
jgi:hypothetical protein